MNDNSTKLSRRDFFGMAGVLGAALVAMPGARAFALEFPEQKDPICLIPNTHVAGTTHVPGIAPLAEALCAGDELVLEREPENPFDSLAIRVLNVRGKRLGFIPRAQNEVIARLMDGGKRVFAKVTGVELINTWFKISIEVWIDD